MTKRMLMKLAIVAFLLVLVAILPTRFDSTSARVEANEIRVALDPIREPALSGYGAADSLQEKTAQSQDKPAEEVYKNIQIFKGLPAPGVMRAMAFFTKSLGVECTHCHVAGEFEKDDKLAKQTARKMYAMVQLSNKNLNTNRVSCYACHRGHTVPELPPDSWKAEMDEMRKKGEQDQRPAEQVYKNIQILKGLPAGRWMLIMTMFTKSLGVDCTYCHVAGEFEKDDKPAKQTARKMLALTGAISREIYKGPTSINCYTCHRGQTQPVSFPPATAPAGPGGNPASVKPPEISRAGQLPTVDQVLTNYSRAIGNAGRSAPVTSRVFKGSLVAEGGLNAPLEIYSKAPDKMCMVMHTPPAPATVIFDGKTFWQQNQNGLREASGKDGQFLKRLARSFAGGAMKEIYETFEIKGKTKLGDRETFVIDATATGATETLYFDCETGLLLREDFEVEGPDAKTRIVVEFEDYRPIDGIRVAFIRRWSRPDFTFTQKFDEIKQNVAIDEAKFEKPASR